jgi:hypothetical protein
MGLPVEKFQRLIVRGEKPRSFRGEAFDPDARTARIGRSRRLRPPIFLDSQMQGAAP